MSVAPVRTMRSRFSASMMLMFSRAAAVLCRFSERRVQRPLAGAVAVRPERFLLAAAVDAKTDIEPLRAVRADAQTQIRIDLVVANRRAGAQRLDGADGVDKRCHDTDSKQKLWKY
ncbi:hypothetical protein PPMP20_37940 [Paraburkholderia phymatum]|uniref:hypothetical protein n=1 Tax=Paraburkholderia phymatum TaxID=148447 RepID=UPI00059EED32|nr:hypothetical protein [Paraburkholderia phymatum]